MAVTVGTIEWARVSPDKIVVATPAQAWLHRASLADAEDPFAAEMQDAGSLETTRALLDAAIGAGQRSALRGEARPQLTLARWAWRLAGYYHTTHATPRLMRDAGERFAAMGCASLAQYARDKVDDEGGHDRLALRDLRSLGYDSERLVLYLVPPTAAALVEYFTELVRGDHPAACVGYAYALERLAVAVTADYLREIRALLPTGVRATRCVEVHSSCGSDLDHVEDAVRVAASLSAEERTRIAVACYRTAILCTAVPPEGHLAEEDLERRLAQFRVT